MLIKGFKAIWHLSAAAAIISVAGPHAVNAVEHIQVNAGGIEGINSGIDASKPLVFTLLTLALNIIGPLLISRGARGVHRYDNDLAENTVVAGETKAITLKSPTIYSSMLVYGTIVELVGLSLATVWFLT